MKNQILFLFSFISTFTFAQPACQWAFLPIGPTQSYNTIYNATTDHNGNVIVVGKLLGTADMNPAAGVADTSFTNGGYNYYISKTSPSGNLLWIHYFEDNSQLVFFEYTGLKVNSADEIILAGNFYGMIDFDLSEGGVDTLRSHLPTYPDFFVAKYNANGNYQWANNLGDISNNFIESQAITILPNDNIVVTANPNGAVDIDPGAQIHNTIGGNANLICYNSGGNYHWNNHIPVTYSYALKNNSLDADADGNTYLLSVGYYELTVTKFDINGVMAWSKTIGNFPTGDRVNPQSVLVDKTTGNFYVAGTFEGNVDFDPNAPEVIYSSTSDFYQDGFMAKYDTDMNLLWAIPFHGNISFGDYSLDFDNEAIVAVGSLLGTIDFGGGISLSSPTFLSPFYITFNSAGIAQSGFTINGSGKYNTISTGPNQSFATTGYITAETDMDPTDLTLTLNTTSTNFFTAVYQRTEAFCDSISIDSVYIEGGVLFLQVYNSSQHVVIYPFFTTILDTNPYIQLDDTTTVPSFLSIPGDGNNGYTTAAYFGTIEPAASVPLNTVFTGTLTITDPNDATFSCSQPFSFTYGDFFTAAKEPDAELLQIFPNPCNGQFRMLLPTDQAEIIITNALGQEVLKTYSVGKIMDIQLDNNGVYWVSVNTKQGTATRKLVVSNS